MCQPENEANRGVGLVLAEEEELRRRGLVTSGPGAGQAGVVPDLSGEFL